MDERLFTRLAALLDTQPVVLASVTATRGAVPRRAGARMLVTADATEFSVGGGMAESRVVEAARELLRGCRPSHSDSGPSSVSERASARDDSASMAAATGGVTVGGAEDPTLSATMSIDLTGRAGSAGVCGGSMSIALKRWDPEDRARAIELSTTLQSGRIATLHAIDAGAGADATLHPDERLLIVGGGHCALALYELARHLEFDIWVHDERADCFDQARFASATILAGPAALLARALETPRPVYAVLLNREYRADVEALEVLCARPPALVTMMGSRKRIDEVRAALPGHDAALARVVAPTGIEIGAETPHEIAVSILAQLVAFRRAGGTELA